MGLSLLLRRSRPFLTLTLVLGAGIFGEIVALGPPELLSMVFMLIDRVLLDGSERGAPPLDHRR